MAVAIKGVLTEADAYTIVEEFIGFHGGTIPDFTDTEFRSFIVLKCGLDSAIWDATPGTKRFRFKDAIVASPPDVQKNVLQALLKKFPPSTDGPARPNRKDARPKVEAMLAKLSGVPLAMIASPSQVVMAALEEAEKTKVPHAIDNFHTALHGYLKHELATANVAMPAKIGLKAAFELLRKHHPKMQPKEAWEGQITQAMEGLADVLDAMNKVRNDWSLAHPNKLLPDREAQLFANAARSFLNYLEARLR